MTQNRNPRLPGIEAILADHARQLRELSRAPGARIYVGTYPGGLTTPESPPYQNGWMNDPTPGFLPVSFYINKWQRVFIDGVPVGGALGSVIFTLPHAYRPPGSQRFAQAGNPSGTIIQVDPTGDVIQVS